MSSTATDISVTPNDQSNVPVVAASQTAPSLLGLPDATSPHPSNSITDLVPTMAPRPGNSKQNPKKRGRTEDGSSSPTFKVIFNFYFCVIVLVVFSHHLKFSNAY
jgi:hypothetical protein